MPVETVKVLAVGESGVGKTSLLSCYARSTFHGGVVPKVYYPGRRTVLVDGMPTHVVLFDTTMDVSSLYGLV